MLCAEAAVEALAGAYQLEANVLRKKAQAHRLLARKLDQRAHALELKGQDLLEDQDG